MIDHLLELRLKYNANVTKFKKITSMHYAVMTSAINVLLNNTTLNKEYINCIKAARDKEYKDKIEFDTSLILDITATQKIINYYKTFHDEIKKDLCSNRIHQKNYYEKFKKIADRTFETRKHVQKG